ncbi:glutathione ABC transporter substrate-binding protein [Lacicoccus alkaliphilus]|uniref:Peptide/nickel transport system substrate-binding protein n=1 Tax=Lacicoccus alkaliphilus DSM 16010 TaxID=1123231 RepID=A0A1M7F1T8_9BACL|nr:glutathione ABC transporter substrate-binding protein [Salinicoccus alkaliphilus]SHL97990.1 peptide/nickel transport system substrate-binding protein [Salinicoccus alkaliphilus DSM 16010]
MEYIHRLSLLVLSVLVLTACTNDGDGGNSVSGNEESADIDGGNLVISTGNDIVSLDPHASNELYSDQVRNTIYEGLVTQDENFEIEPLLAEEWEQLDDLTWRFELREDVEFHDGSAFNAEVVKANLDRLVDPAVASPRLSLFEMISSVEVIDEHTVEITTEYPFAPLLSHLTHDGGGMISKAVIDEDYRQAIENSGAGYSVDEYYELREAGGESFEEAADEISGGIGSVVDQNPVGTNYAMFESRSPGENIVLNKNEDYWQDPMNLDSITFKIVAETGARMAELETGTSHIMFGYDSSNIERIENHPETEAYNNSNVSINFIGFNTQKAPLDDVRVRQAISHAVDRHEIIEGIFNGIGEVPNGPLIEGMAGDTGDIEGFEYDLEEAGRLMGEAGHEDGFELSIITNDAPERVDTAIYLQEALAELNIIATVEQIEWGTYLEEASSGEHDVFLLGWPNFTGDPDQALWPLFHSSMHGAQGNRTFYDNPELDALLEAGREEKDEEARAEIYEEAQAVLVEDAPAIYFNEGVSMNAYRSEVEGLYIDDFIKPDFRNVTIGE